MPNKIDHKNLQTQINSAETVYLEAGDLAIANQLSEKMDTQETLSDGEKRSLLEEIKKYFPDSKKDDKKLAGIKIDTLLIKVKEVGDTEKFEQDTLVDLLLSFNEMVTQFSFGKISSKHFDKLTLIRKLLESKQDKEVESIQTNCISEARERNLEKTIEELEAKMYNLKNIMICQPSRFDNVEFRTPLIYEIFPKDDLLFSNRQGTSLMYKYMVENFNDLLQEYERLASLLIGEIKRTDFYYLVLRQRQGYNQGLDLNLKVRTTGLDTMRQYLLLIEEILESEKDLIIPVKNRLMQAEKFYINYLSNFES
jgi:hypothetical protein